MKKWLIGLMALCVPYCGTPAYAEGLEFVPKWHMTGNEACYDIQGAKTLLKLDADMSNCMQQRQLATQAVEKLKEANLNLTHALELTTKSETLLKTRDTELTQKLKDCVAAKNDAEASQSPSIAWPMLGSVILIGVGVVIGHYVLK